MEAFLFAIPYAGISKPKYPQEKLRDSGRGIFKCKYDLLVIYCFEWPAP